MPKDQEGQKKPSTDALLREIRDNYSYYMEESRDIREEARTDMRYVAGDPWDPKEKAARNQPGSERPCMVWDELSPYINQLVNEPRQNKRTIKAAPRGAGANDKTAELRQGLIYEILYNSKAQAAFTTGFQGAAERSYGYWAVSKRYVTPVGESADTQNFNQELYIRRIPNPDTVLFDPSFREIDASDAMGCFVTDVMRRVDFKRRYPKARITDFTDEHVEAAPGWIQDKVVQLAEYWRVTLESRTLHLIENKSGGPVALYEDELPGGFDLNLSKRQRKIEKRVVTQYITNGVEILDETQIEIPYIPVVPCFGKELYVDKGGGSKRMLISLVRMARDPFMSYCFYRSQEAEEAGLSPKVPYFMYAGQQAGHEDELALLNKVPRAYQLVNPTTPETGENVVLPLPSRNPFVPNFAAYEEACEAARRAIQTAMGGTALPLAAQRMNEKSGAALKEIDKQEDKGTFHFIDNYNFALEHTGRILDAWIPYVYDTERDVAIRKPDDSSATLRINDPANMNQQGEAEHWDAKTGEHGITIDTGPDFQSQRAEASEFADSIISNLEGIAAILPPGAPAKLLALSIKLKSTLGPIGAEMADIISPPEDEQGKAQAMQQAQVKMQQQQELMQAMQQELEKLKLEKAGKVIDNQFKMQVAEIDRDVKVLVALITAKNKQAEQEFEMYKTFMSENHQAAHEAAMQAVQHGHEADQSAGQQAHEASQAAAAQVSASPDATNSGQGD